MYVRAAICSDDRSLRPPCIKGVDFDKFRKDGVIFVGDLDDAARDRIRLVRVDTDFETVYFSPFVLAVLNMGIDRTGRLACACHKLLFVRGGSGTETVNERSSKHRHERRDRQSPMIVEGNRIKRR